MATATSSLRALPLEKRQEEARRMLNRFADRVPVIAVRHLRSSLPNIKQNKFLVPHELTVSQFQTVLRKRIALDQRETLFLFVETVKNDKLHHALLPAAETMGDIYNSKRDEDGFVYFIYSNEEVFGGAPA